MGASITYIRTCAAVQLARVVLSPISNPRSIVLDTDKPDVYLLSWDSERKPRLLITESVVLGRILHTTTT